MKHQELKVITFGKPCIQGKPTEARVAFLEMLLAKISEQKAEYRKEK